MPPTREPGLDYQSREEPEHLHYSPQEYPEIAARLELLNQLARYDQTSREVTFPSAGEPSQEALALTEALDEQILAARGSANDLAVASFDIDLTIHLPDEDDPAARGTVPVDRLRELRAGGYIVGTCSDRDPSDQLETMERLGFTPDFCIPKELLGAAGKLLDGARLTHVGDDDRRDRRIAQESGWEHLWPWEHSGL